MDAARWLGWDGRCLRWRCAVPAVLCLDGVRFERADGGEHAREFEASPSGNAELEFALHAADGAALLPRWRVLLGQPAAAGAQAWDGAVRAMRPLHAAFAAAAPPAQVSIVVPIYNSPQCVQRCIAAVLRWTRAPARLILIDDASPDPAIGALLAGLAGAPDVLVRRNAENLGYTRSTNLGIELAGEDDVVLLNSDTEVGPCWLQTLQAACADDAIGTATAVSDNAGAFTVPELEEYCPIPPRWTLAQTQRALLHHAGGCRPELPTGNGFCLYVKRRMLDRVGAYDAEAFPYGYGEENDLCQRAERAGFRHVIAGDVFVRHARSASFGAERRAALGAQGMAVLRARYPDYEAKVGATLFSFARRVLDYRVRRLYAGIDAFAAEPPRPRLLLGGDAVALASALRETHECLVAEPRAGRARLRCLEHGDACLTLTTSEGEAPALAALLRVNAVETVHLHGATELPLGAAARLAGVPCVDTSDEKSIPTGDAALRAHCASRYAAAWNALAAFPQLSVTEPA